MDKFQRWIVERDVECVKHVGIFVLFNMQLSFIQPLVKEFLQVIIWFNLDIIELIIQGVLVFIIEK